MENQNNGLIWDEDNHFGKVLIVCLAKNLHRLQSILILCKRGFAKDAIPLLRSMFEELVDLEYMNKNRMKVQDFLDYDYYSRLKLSNILSKIKDERIDSDKMQKRDKELNDDWNNVKKKFTKSNGKIHERWTCKNIREISEEIGLGESYLFVFGYLSNYIHSNSISASDYVLGKDKNNKVVLEIGTTPNFVKEVLSTASIFFISILGIIDDEYKMGLEKILKEYVAILKKQK